MPHREGNRWRKSWRRPPPRTVAHGSCARPPDSRRDEDDYLTPLRAAQPPLSYCPRTQAHSRVARVARSSTPRGVTGRWILVGYTLMLAAIQHSPDSPPRFWTRTTKRECEPTVLVWTKDTAPPASCRARLWSRSRPAMQQLASGAAPNRSSHPSGADASPRRMRERPDRRKRHPPRSRLAQSGGGMCTAPSVHSKYGGGKDVEQVDVAAVDLDRIAAGPPDMQNDLELS